MSQVDCVTSRRQQSKGLLFAVTTTTTTTSSASADSFQHNPGLHAERYGGVGSWTRNKANPTVKRSRHKESSL